MKLKLITAAVVALVASTGALATTTPWGVHDPVEVGTMLVAPGPFLDIFSFSIPTLSSVASTAVAANVSISVPVSVDVLKILGGTYSLWIDPDGIPGNFDETSMAGWTWGFSGSTGSVSNSVSSLAPGSYYYAVGGSAMGVSGGHYTLVSSVTAVPEPETLAMMLAGLGALGFLARRRQNS